jgi:predicted nucleic acid-binding protein
MSPKAVLSKPRVYLDATPAIAILNPDHLFHEKALKTMVALSEFPEVTFFASTYLRMECNGRKEFAINGTAAFDRLLNRVQLSEIELSTFIAEQAVGLIAANSSLKSADAVHLATARYAHCTHFFTNDKDIRVLPEMEFVTLSVFEANA